MKRIIKPNGEILTKRKDRKRQAASNEAVAHNVWVVKLNELIATGLNADEAFEELKNNVKSEEKNFHPTRLAQYRAAWLSFERKVNAAKKQTR